MATSNVDECAWHHVADEEFLCHDCKISTLENREYYMVVDSVWQASKVPEKAMLCIGCLEKRLGHKLVPSDFSDFPVNTMPGLRSNRLMDRLGEAI